jgi:hypothetical protein
MLNKSLASRRAARAATATTEVNAFADRAVARQEEQRREVEATLARKASRILEEGRRQAQAAVGKTRYAELRAKIHSERLALRELGQPPEGLKRDYQKDRNAAKRRIEAYLRGLGARGRRIEKIQQDTNARLRKLLATDSRRTGSGYSLAGPGDVWKHVTGVSTDVMINPVLAPPEDRRDPHRWFKYRPSYDAFRTDPPGGIASYGFDVRVRNFANVAGWLGSDLELEEATDWERQLTRVYYRNGVGINFTPRIAGRLEVVIAARCVWDIRKVSIVDELGLSDAFVRQENRFFLTTSIWEAKHTLVTPISTEDTESDGDDVSRNIEKLNQGQQYCAHFVSEQEPILPQGDRTRVTVGSENSIYASSDDMKVRCQSFILWDVHTVWLRIRP